MPLWWFLVLSAALFCIGLFGAITRKNSVGILISIELMLNAANINLLSFWRYLYAPQGDLKGQVFVIIVFVVAAAEAAVGLALIISAYRSRQTVIANEMDSLKG
ncbi:MAG: NADH-quinone oxidoreductase subunit NuoK [Chloroflexi bacterium]|nr:NADH-quinone oxidoreductase subunit NuoK [Chloroflexota bacterium]